ncbi:MAG: flagellar biosynthesis protein FlhF [Lachnospiraceae bacterium]|nr:flagellar biosynthesis protein FlhF [Lachnospiraceae bacterium]
MIIKKYTAETEEEAIMMAKEELGSNAIVMNMKKIKPRGFRRFFQKPSVEITAAVDDPAVAQASKPKVVKPEPKEEKSTDTSAIEKRLDNLAMLLEQKVANEAKQNKIVSDVAELARSSAGAESEKAEEPEVDEATKARDRFIELAYNQLHNNEVNENYAKTITEELKSKDSKTPLDEMLGFVYQKLVLKLGEIHTIDTLEDKTKFLFFIGPTGVGKTTTIAKLAATYKLEKDMKVALLTADTYRIAAEEQLKTYAGIMDLPIDIIYTADDLKEKMDSYKEYNLVFVDTVGHSYKNQEQREEIQALLDCIPIEQRDVFLVLSATTKYNDLLRITKTYETMTKYSMIFTKLDETGAYGNILNLKLATGAMLSYVAWGQNVPDDIGELNAQKIARQLLGGCD